jgi:cupin fold WbuC family metalloprotein
VQAGYESASLNALARNIGSAPAVTDGGKHVSNELKLLSRMDRERLAHDAATAARARAHLLLHPSHTDQVQRFVVSLNPESYIAAHCHPEQWEMLAVLQGSIRVVVFNADGLIARLVDLSPEGTSLIEVPAGCWHSLLSLQAGTTVLEVKPGPFRQAEFASWAPAENAPRAAEAARWLRHAREGDLWT